MANCPDPNCLDVLGRTAPKSGEEPTPSVPGCDHAAEGRADADGAEKASGGNFWITGVNAMTSSKPVEKPDRMRPKP